MVLGERAGDATKARPNWLRLKLGRPVLWLIEPATEARQLSMKIWLT